MESLLAVWVFALLFRGLASQQTAPDLSRCPKLVQTSHYGRTFGERCFLLVTFHPRTWADAQQDCSTHGGQLVQVRDQATQDFLSRALEELHFLEDGVAIGLSDAQHEGDWRWTNGEKAVYTNWQDGQPEHSLLANIEDCVYMERSHGYKWADNTCHLFVKKYAYICQFDMTPVITTASTTSSTTPVITTPSTTRWTTVPSTPSPQPVTASEVPTEKPLKTHGPKQTTTITDSTTSEPTSRLPDKLTQTTTTTTTTTTSKGTTKMTTMKLPPTSASSTTTMPTTAKRSTSTTTTTKSSTVTTQASTASTASLPTLTTILAKPSTTKTSSPLLQTSPNTKLDSSPKSSPAGLGAVTPSSSNPSSAKPSQMPSSSASSAAVASTTAALSSNPRTKPPSSSSSQATAPQTTQTTTVATTTQPTTQLPRTYPAYCGDFICSLDCSARGSFQVDVDGCPVCSCNS